MATLNIQGQKVKVDDAFLSMTPEQQNAAVDEIAKSLPAAPPNAAATDADARAKAGIAKAQQIIAGGGPEPEGGHEAPTFVPSPDMGAMGTYLTSTGEGVPIAGPYIDKGLTAASAAIGSLLTGELYSKVNAEMTRMNEASREAHPVARTLGNVTGAVAGTLPAMMAAPEVFGIGAASKPLQYGLSALSGAAINGADSAVRSGGDIKETGKGAGIGFATGLAAPFLAPLIGKGVKAVADNLHIGAVARALGLDKTAAKVLAGAVRQDAVDPAALSQLGDNGMLMDLGANMRHTAGAIAATPGEGKAIVRNAIGARDANANWRIRSALDETLGEAPTPSRIIDRANTNQQRLAPEYQEALRDAGPVDTLPIARYLETEAQTLRGEPQRLVQRVRSMLDHQPTPADIARARADGQPPPGTSLVSDAGELLNTRHAIDDMLETTQGTNAVNALTTARQTVDDELRASVPGIKEVDAKYAELARQKEAVGRGQSVLSSGREAPRPDELAAEVRQGALPQGLQVGPSAVPLRLREGARAEIERIVGTNANDRVALQRLIKGEGDWNRARLSTLFGSDKARSIIDLLDREKLFADTSNIVTRNSETAARVAAREAIDPANAPGFGLREGFIAGGARGAARAAGMRTVDKVIDALNNGGNEKAIADMARTLIGGPQQSAVLEALMKAGRGSQIQQSQVDRVARALLLSGPAGANRP
ncbi:MULTISPECIES: hypothetical protein [Mesorhizobium]|uniref:hypothetical protein n=6 Tax=Phyllobacteriaceae TaxID=69277 RepID=UPI000FC9DED3|nr:MULTISPECIES: hypothetical protein [Mesorhizobium]RVB44064.1 hypothetical protein EN918_06375 [Mesorhizobium sp. M7A.F.Ca.CA.004.05.1.1]MCF6124403.1 hypothetical protein [Mesorhizobium ciceri]MCQ8816636.1 hypothetical protein [Mesorhizobium sp. SEMIA396]RUX82438.1 hypothetical protein EN983_00985 [Mesorhizobium sp. M7A.F.Ca.CA.004.08.2.1]RUX82986.1 hypothetical protein EN982_29080 [Mesorhizobium sp. M7A.F.Ca.CA.004.08.1.1]